MHSFQFFLLLPTIFCLPIHGFTIQTATNISYSTYYNCTNNSTFAPSSAYYFNLKTLLSWLSSNANNNAGFYNTTVASKSTSDTVHGLFYCRLESVPESCQECVIEAAKFISSQCPEAKEAIIWHKICFVRYSNRSFISTVEESPKISFMNKQDYVGHVGHFNAKLWDIMNDLRTQAAKAPIGSRRFAYRAVKITDNQTLYGVAWCIPYLSPENCSWCLGDAVAEIPTSCCRGKTGGNVIYPSCGVRYELYPIYKTVNLSPLPTPASPRPSTRAGRRKQHTLVIIVVVAPIVLVVLLSLGLFCFQRRKERKNREAILKQSFGSDVTTLESLQFDLDEIEAATNKFSTENKIGRGGFGEVYKGILSDGQEIAVKRLIGTSGQGAEEFKNEVLVIAKLQHRNLVKLLGFCLEGQEKILIYEYVSNKSLDYFLFDPQKPQQLSWFERYNIIKGIARGILYLHEDSRLKIIHRDLKPSNILLDSNMNAKISDFGMARIVIADQTEESTRRIVGTYGYMSPEYAMHGQFSIKSDVYSFGVMVLEIISGKRKLSSYESEYLEDMRTYAWIKWRDQTPLELLDSTLKTSYSQDEVIKCIHIGLLCVQEDPNDRPTMATVIFSLNSPSLDLPLPHEPVYFKRSIREDNGPGKELDSINEFTVTKLFPR